MHQQDDGMNESQEPDCAATLVEVERFLCWNLTPRRVHKGLPHVFPRGGEILQTPATLGVCSRNQGIAALILVVDRPAGIRDVVLLQELQPELGLSEVEGAIAMRLAEAPLRHKERDAVAQGLLGLAPNGRLVRAGVEMQGVCHVGIVQGLLGSNVNVLAPGGRPTGDQVRAVLANGAKDGLMIWPNHIRP